MMIAKKARVKLTLAIVGALMLIGVSSAQAAPIVLHDNNVAYRILNLEVGGTLYNIDFEFKVWPEIYGPTPVFDFTPELAQEANEKINLALNAADVKQVGPPQDQQINEGFPLYGIGVIFDEAYVGWIGATFVDNIDLWVDDFLGTPVGGFQILDQRWLWADATVVPIPAAVWLLGGGLIGLLGLRRRFKN